MAVGKGMRRGARKRGLASLAGLGIVVIAGLLAAWGVSPVETSEIAPADIVALRFPADWMNSADTTGAAQAPAPASFQLASADTRLDATLLFSPYQTYPAPMPGPAAPVAQPSAVAPAAAVANVAPQTKPETKPAVVPTRSIAAAAPRKPAPRARKESGELFNDAQLASIKTRLKLSEYQEQYWPPVETALRAIGQRVAHGGVPRTAAMGYASESRIAQIDPDSAEVQQLKSAAFPLIMSMNDDQKQQVRTLAHVMGLERVASSF